MPNTNQRCNCERAKNGGAQCMVHNPPFEFLKPVESNIIKEQELREEYHNWYNWYEHESPEIPTRDEIADWWLAKRSQLLQEIEESVKDRQKLFNFIPRDKGGYKMVKESDLDLLTIINSFK